MLQRSLWSNLGLLGSEPTVWDCGSVGLAACCSVLVTAGSLRPCLAAVIELPRPFAAVLWVESPCSIAVVKRCCTCGRNCGQELRGVAGNVVGLAAVLRSC